MLKEQEKNQQNLNDNVGAQDEGIVYFEEQGNYQSAYEMQPQQGVKVKKPKKIKKRWIILGIIVLLFLIIRIGSCEPQETYEWPSDNPVAAMLPTPDGEITYLNIDDEEGEEYLNASVDLEEPDMCKSYIDACKEKGFTLEPDSSFSKGDFHFPGKNVDGWQVEVYNYEEDMTITLSSPGYLKGLEVDSSDESDSSGESSDDSSSGSTSSNFKETMDAYEDCVDDYVSFMKKYNNSSNQASMMSEYSEMLQDYTDFAKKIDNIDEVVAILRSSKSIAEGKQRLSERFGLDGFAAHRNAYDVPAELLQ